MIESIKFLVIKLTILNIKFGESDVPCAQYPSIPDGYMGDTRSCAQIWPIFNTDRPVANIRLFAKFVVFCVAFCVRWTDARTDRLLSLLSNAFYCSFCLPDFISYFSYLVLERLLHRPPFIISRISYF